MGNEVKKHLNENFIYARQLRSNRKKLEPKTYLRNISSRLVELKNDWGVMEQPGTLIHRRSRRKSLGPVGQPVAAVRSSHALALGLLKKKSSYSSLPLEEGTLLNASASARPRVPNLFFNLRHEGPTIWNNNTSQKYFEPNRDSFSWI